MRNSKSNRVMKYSGSTRHWWKLGMRGVGTWVLTLKYKTWNCEKEHLKIRKSSPSRNMYSICFLPIQKKKKMLNHAGIWIYFKGILFSVYPPNDWQLILPIYCLLNFFFPYILIKCYIQRLLVFFANKHDTFNMKI